MGKYSASEDHPLDISANEERPVGFGAEEDLDLFAEELPSEQQHSLPENSLSTLGCECGLSTFFCFGCS